MAVNCALGQQLGFQAQGVITTQFNRFEIATNEEAEAQFSGVNLDSQAAALIEFQQAYQASSRILQTARELFQTLIDSV